MKTIAFIVTMLMSSTVFASGPLPKYWYCMQIGWINNTPAIIMSDIKDNSDNPGKNYKIREKKFQEQVKKVWELKNTYAPLCQDFADKKQAITVQKYAQLEANKKGVIVYPMEFKYGNKNETPAAEKK